MTTEVRAVCFPQDDHVFMSRVRTLIEHPSGTPLQAAIEASLRDVPAGSHLAAAFPGVTGWRTGLVRIPRRFTRAGHRHGRPVKLQAQAVLRREDPAAPLRLVGVLLAGSFYPLTPHDAWGPLHLEVGLVALAPLTPVLTSDVGDGAVQAMGEARTLWSVLTQKRVELLSWLPIDQVRTGADAADEDIPALIEQMTAASNKRSRSTPSTPPYHSAARELERLAGLVFEASSTEERIAEDHKIRKDDMLRENDQRQVRTRSG